MGIRISIGRIVIGGSGGINWAAYWLTRYPSLLILTIDDDTQITLAWTNNGVADYDDMRIERRINVGAWGEINTAVLGTNTYANCGLTPNQYDYRLRYRNGTHYSAYSNIALVVENDFYIAIGSVITEDDLIIRTEDSMYLIQE